MLSVSAFTLKISILTKQNENLRRHLAEKDKLIEILRFKIQELKQINSSKPI